MSETPDLSILIVNWNGKAILRHLLESILATAGQLRVQTIVVDNASSDGSAEMVAEEFPTVLLQSNAENAGFAVGNNQAASAADAPLLLLLNNDTFLRNGALQRLVEFLNQRPDVVAVGPKLIGSDGKPQRSGRSLPTLAALLHSIQLLKWTGLFRAAYRRYRNRAFDPDKPGRIGQLAAAALLIRRDAFEGIGGFDEGFRFGVEDVDLCRRLKDLGLIWYLPSAEVEHLGRVSSRANRGFVYRGYECGWARYLRKHHPPGEARLYKTLVTLDMPVRLLVMSIQLSLELILNRQERAARTWSRLTAAMEFVTTGMVVFWRS